jgi:hypothetical protein
MGQKLPKDVKGDAMPITTLTLPHPSLNQVIVWGL